MNIIFRADASTTIGTGHIVRCLTLANALNERGVTVSFICRKHEGHLCESIKKQGFAVHELPLSKLRLQIEDALSSQAWLGDSWQMDAEQTSTVIKNLETKPDWLVVDHYAINQSWENILRPFVRKIMVLDDLNNRPHNCDLLLDQNLVANMHNRYLSDLSPTYNLLLGPQYALLQPIYAQLRSCISPRNGTIQRIFIFFGGADKNNLTGRTIAAFLRLNRLDIEVDVILTTGNPHIETIHEQVKGYKNIHLHHSLSTLAPLMVKADLAIGASGTTSWERLCLGLPALVVSLTDNQRPIADELHRKGLIHWLGHQDEVDELIISEAINKLIKEGLDRNWSMRCLDIVDGNGASRVCKALTVTASESLHVRHANLKDEALLLEWANDPITRRYAFSLDPIPAKTHHIWFRNRLNNLDKCHLYIVETTDGVALGQVRFEFQNQSWEVHYSVAPEFRKQRLGANLLEAAIQKLNNNIGRVSIFARVKIDNQPSIKIFEALGFEALPNIEERVAVYRRFL